MSIGSSKKNKSGRIKSLILSAMFLALCLVLPFVTGQVPQIGNMLCPMHLPVLLCGFICGWQWGLTVGLIAPLLRSVLFAAPTLYPAAIAMAFELAVYGLMTGVLYKLLPKKTVSIYIALLVSMIAGRIVWGAVRLALAGLTGAEFTFQIFFKRSSFDGNSGNGDTDSAGTAYRAGAAKKQTYRKERRLNRLTFPKKHPAYRLGTQGVLY